MISPALRRYLGRYQYLTPSASSTKAPVRKAAFRPSNQTQRDALTLARAGLGYRRIARTVKAEPGEVRKWTGFLRAKPA